LTKEARQSQSSHQNIGIFPFGLLTHRDQKRRTTATVGRMIEGIISWMSSGVKLSFAEAMITIDLLDVG
jgi:hypothetical protein